ncbi:MAG: GntR family transcriptional regulator [Pseudoclavibacter sp.]
MPTLNTPSVVDALYDDLRSRILQGEAPGTQLTELRVSDAYKVARPTAKAAIERLISDGLLERASRRAGPTIPRLTKSDIIDLYATRSAIESHAHRLLGGADPVLSQPEFHNAELLAASAARDAVGVIEADIKFHRTLIALTNSPRLVRIHNLLLGEAHLCMAQVQSHQLLSAANIAEEHAAILAAVQSGNQDAITKTTTRHLQHAQDKLLLRLFPEGES